MRKLGLIIIGLLLFCKGYSQVNKQNRQIIFPDKELENSKFILIDKLLYQIDNDNIIDTIKIFKIPDWNDPGDFQKIQVILSSGKTYDIYNAGDWINIDSEDSVKFCKLNKIITNRLLITKISNEKTFLIILGYGYASKPGILTVLDLNKGNLKVKFRENFEIDELKDIDNDGILEIIGHTNYAEGGFGEETDSSYQATYSPFHVLKVKADSVITDDSLSMEYNNKNYVGFVGFLPDNVSEIVIFPKKGSSFKPYFKFVEGRKFPQATLRYLTKDELKVFSNEELRLMRNEIFASHGYKFSSKDLKEYFSKQKWYEPTDINMNEIYKYMNKYETVNIKLIKELESNQK